MSAQAQAAYEEMVADYQGSVLTALQEVEDNLAALRVLREEADIQQGVVAAADPSVTLANNRYRGGVASYLEVTAAQNAALSSRRIAADILSRRLSASVLLIKALGGGWNIVASRAEGRRALTRLLPVLPVLLLLVSPSGCTRTPLSYEDEISAWHAEKDRYMREAPDSPVPADKRPTFPALVYFPIDRSYRTGAELTPVQGGPTLEMPTSTGQLRKMRRVGTLSFTLKDRRSRSPRSSRPTSRTCAGSSCRSAT